MSLKTGQSAKPKATGLPSSSVVRTMLLVLLPLTLLPLLLMGGGAFLRARTLLRDQAVAQLHTTLKSEVELIQNWANRKQIRLGFASYRPAFRDPVQALISGNGDPVENREASLAALQTYTQLDARQTFNEFLVLNDDGQVVAATQPGWEGLMVSEAYLESFWGQSRSLAVYSPSPLYEDELVIITSQPFFDSRGRLSAGILGVSESPDILRTLQSVPLANTAARLYFISDQGDFLAPDRFSTSLILRKPGDSQQQSLLPLRGEGTSAQPDGQPYILVDTTSFDGQPVMASYTWLPALKLGAVVEVPESIVFQQLGSLTNFSALLLLGTIVLLGVVIWLGVLQVARPLLQVARTMRDFTDGYWDERIELEREDEIGLVATTFNQLADALTALYRSLGDQVESRSQQVRTAAEVAQIATSTTELDELLQRTVDLIVERFGHYHASVFLTDEAQEHAKLRASTGPVGAEMKARGHGFAVGSRSMIGWVTANNQPRVASDVSEDPVHFKNELLPGTRSEVGIPIAIGNQVMGALDVQSRNPDAFDSESIAALQTLANLIASALQKVRLLQSTQVDLRELNMLYQVGREIASAETPEQVFSAVEGALQKSSYRNVFYLAVGDGFRLQASSSPIAAERFTLPERLEVRPESIRFHPGMQLPVQIIDPAGPNPLPGEFQDLVERLGWVSVGHLPVAVGNSLAAVILFGEKEKGGFSYQTLQPYAGLTELAAIALEKVQARQSIQQRLAELQTLGQVGRIITTQTELDSLYELFYSQIKQIMGAVEFQIALFDAAHGRVEVPFAIRDDQRVSVEPFLLGEGLLSLVITSGEPLLLVKDVQQRAEELGAQLSGPAAMSWLGVPLIVADQVIGVITVQDRAREDRFTPEDLNLMTTLAAQIGVAIRNARLLGETQARASQLELASEISADVSRSLDVDQLLQRAIELLRARFGFYFASIYMLDQAGEHAVIRQSTGEIGDQLKAAGFQLRVDSDTLIGKVTGEARTIVVNDLLEDTRFGPNPLLPETRAELGTPLQVGKRLLGALNVHSRKADAFSSEDIRVLQILAEQLAVALANAELFRETQENLAKHRLLHEVTSAAASGTTVEEALNRAAQGLASTLGHDRVSIFLFNRERQVLERKALAGADPGILTGTTYQVDQGITGWVARHQKPALCKNVRSDPRRWAEEGELPALLALPLLYRAELLGVLRLEKDQPGAYTVSDQELMGTLSGTLAAVIANTRLIERQRQLFEVTNRIRRSVTTRQVLETTVSELSTALGAHRARIRVGAGGTPLPALEEDARAQSHNGSPAPEQAHATRR